MNTSKYGIPLLKTIHALYSEGIRRMVVILRHSARRYMPGQMETELYLGLTEEGKTLAYDFGQGLPQGYRARFYSSPVGRCIETAYLIDKGYSDNGGKTENNKLQGILASSFVNDPFRSTKLIYEIGVRQFLLDWFNSGVPPEVINTPEQAAARMHKYAISKLAGGEKDIIDICVSHDLNIGALKKCGLGLENGESAHVDFLEGAVFYNKHTDYCIKNHMTEAEIQPASNDDR